ncbi:MAG: hypothetical protein K2L81_01035 [Muribaculaceae bacterium]|nr:hypothetical protein [Muribaculaceae bacterium]
MLFGATSSKLPATLDEALQLLSETIENQDAYFKIREDRIDSLKIVSRSEAAHDKGVTYEKIANEYSHYQIDSAMVYLAGAADLFVAEGDTVGAMGARLRYATLLPVIGAYNEAVEIYNSYDPGSIPEPLKSIYNLCGNQLYFYLASTHPLAKERRKFVAKGVESAINAMSDVDDPVLSGYLQAELDFLDNNDVAIIEHGVRLEDVPMTHPYFARFASLIGDYYNMYGNDSDKGLYYKTLAAISDICTANREEMALQNVGMALYERGDVEQAYKCLMVSLDHAVKSGAKVHLSNTAESLNAIAESFSELDQRKYTILIVLVIALAVALIVIVAILVFLRRNINADKRMRALLAEANKQKEAFISQFINLSSVYMESLEDFIRVASRKIKAGQVEDLYQMIKSGKMLDEQNALFCEIFDKAFTRIYPTFVDGVNNLLIPEKRIYLADGVLLNTELRILAFMRLGTEDSSQIARFLQLSVNTVYTYRNKLKNKAVSRDTFESDVMRIARIE